MTNRNFVLRHTKDFGMFPDLRGRRFAIKEGSNIYIPLHGSNFEVLKEPGDYLVDITLGGNLKNGKLRENQASALISALGRYKAKTENRITLNGDFEGFDFGEVLRNYLVVENIIGVKNGFV